jgi:hypothetical protein
MQRFLPILIAVLFAGISLLSTAKAENSNYLFDDSYASDKNWVYQSAENPGNLMIDFAALNSLPYKIHIFAENGQLVYVDDLDFVSSNVIYSVELHDLKKGKYLLSVSAVGDEVYAHHFTKE